MECIKDTVIELGEFLLALTICGMITLAVVPGIPAAIFGLTYWLVR